MDASLKETNIRRSIKKFFLDGITDNKIYFDQIIVPGTEDTGKQWLIVSVENLRPAVVSNAMLTVYMFTVEDSEGDDLAALRDKVLELLYPGYIPLYDTQGSPSWELIGAMNLFRTVQSSTSRTPDGANMVYLQHVIKWASVWS